MTPDSTPDDFDPGPRADVACTPSGDRWTLVFVRRLRQPPERVWSALTDPAQLAQWAPYTTDRDLSRPGPAVLRMIDDGDEGDEARKDIAITVHRAEPPTLLEHSWGSNDLRWELAAADDGRGTELTLRHTVDEPDWAPKVAAGWHLCLVVAERLLDGRPIAPIRGEEAKRYGWERLQGEYAADLGLPATGWPDP